MDGYAENRGDSYMDGYARKEIIWQVSAFSFALEPNIVKEQFSDSAEADKRYTEISKLLANPGDRVVLYRIKRLVVPNFKPPLNPTHKGCIVSHQDVYKSDMLGKDGKLMHLRGVAPSSVPDAEWQQSKAKAVNYTAYDKMQQERTEKWNKLSPTEKAKFLSDNPFMTSYRGNTPYMKPIHAMNTPIKREPRPKES